MKSLRLLSLVFSLGIMGGAVSFSHASGFAVKLNSAELQGRANAGSGVSSDPLAVYNNPAILSQIGLKGGSSEVAVNGTLLFPSVEYKDTFLTPETGNVALKKFTGAMAFGTKINQFVSGGLSITTPYGLAFDYKHNSIVKNYVVNADLRSVAISPSLAFKFNPVLTVGAGFDAQWTDVMFSNYPSNRLPTTFGTAKGDNWHYRGTFGVLIEPTQKIRLGVSIKTRTNARISGDYKVDLPLRSGKASATLSLPTTITLSGSYSPTKELSFYVDCIRTNWSSISSLVLTTPNGEDLVVGDWKDSNFLSIGMDYKYTDRLTIRGGIGVDYTPTHLGPSRVPGIPDSNKIWLAGGCSYEMDPWKFTLSYGHEFFANADIQQPAIRGRKPELRGQIKEHVDLISFQINYRF